MRDKQVQSELPVLQVFLANSVVNRVISLQKATFPRSGSRWHTSVACSGWNLCCWTGSKHLSLN